MTCISCGSSENIHNHHMVPVVHQKGKRGEEKIKATIKLCHRCHLYMEPMIRRITPYDVFKLPNNVLILPNGVRTTTSQTGYSQSEANRICRNLNRWCKKRQVPYRFKVNIFVEHYKTVPSKTFIQIAHYGRVV